MKNKYLVIIALFSWCNIGVFYLLYLNEMETVLTGFLKELTLIPSFLCGIIFPIWVLIRILIRKTKS
jgi:hypothetical protein